MVSYDRSICWKKYFSSILGFLLQLGHEGLYQGLVIPDDFYVDTASDISDSEEEYFESESRRSLPIPFSLKALDYFNSKENTDFELVEDGPTDFGIYFVANPILHINFIAQSPASGLSGLFYAELETSSLCPTDDTLNIEVFGCAMLREVDSGNPRGFGCDWCDSQTLIHPGPLSGYGIHKGDLFKDSIFWKYRSYTKHNEFFGQVLAKDMDFYTACANKAIQHLNSRAVCKFSEGDNMSHATLLDARLRSVSDWELWKVVAAMSRNGSPIHVNFTVKSSDFNDRPMLCFAELEPLPQELYCADWSIEKEQCLKVRGCCMMKEVNSQTQYGRVCGMCLDQLIHPGPAYGYCSIVGDYFAGKDFKRVGCGVF